MLTSPLVPAALSILTGEGRRAGPDLVQAARQEEGNCRTPLPATGTLDALKSRIEVDRYDVEAWETLLGQLKPPSREAG